MKKTLLFLVTIAMIAISCEDHVCEFPSTTPEASLEVIEINESAGLYEFDASGTFDAEIDIDYLRFKWELKNSSGSYEIIQDWEIGKSKIDYIFSKGGDYEIKVTVKDPNELENSTEESFSVTEPTHWADPVDGKLYKVGKIGNQTWFFENFSRETEHSNYYNDSSKYSEYGRFYYLYEAKDICPEGWRVPTIDDIQELMEFAGGQTVAGKKLKSLDKWITPGTDEFGFSALPAGMAGYLEGPLVFVGNGDFVIFWSEGSMWGLVEGEDGMIYQEGDYGAAKLTVRYIRED